MADLRDIHGNPVQLTDELGNPVQLTDEYGNPMHVTGVATMHGDGVQNQMMEPQYRPPPPPPPVSNKEDILQPSAVSNTSSLEHDGKKKGQQEDKIKEEGSQATAKSAVTTARISTQPQPEQEELCLREKIKAKLPW
ncbi:hypothetical protein V6N13_134423 [Hibiscus sabdariffa]|uniref:Late embryogenesis abundant protein-like n=2 Tax=Hibiscus sabdariffa TaxID=183260 RepID=A0ABR1ZFC7_9ROSI